MGRSVNPECKLLLMRHAFETLKFNRVEYKTDARNARSRAAIAKLGATQEGILRKHMIMAGGYVRDSVYFSIVDTDWPMVKPGWRNVSRHEPLPRQPCRPDGRHARADELRGLPADRPDAGADRST